MKFEDVANVTGADDPADEDGANGFGAVKVLRLLPLLLFPKGLLPDVVVVPNGDDDAALEDAIIAPAKGAVAPVLDVGAKGLLLVVDDDAVVAMKFCCCCCCHGDGAGAFVLFPNVEAGGEAKFELVPNAIGCAAVVEDVDDPNNEGTCDVLLAFPKTPPPPPPPNGLLLLLFGGVAGGAMFVLRVIFPKGKLPTGAVVGGAGEAPKGPAGVAREEPNGAGGDDPKGGAVAAGEEPKGGAAGCEGF